LTVVGYSESSVATRKPSLSLEESHSGRMRIETEMSYIKSDALPYGLLPPWPIGSNPQTSDLGETRWLASGVRRNNDARPMSA
jgi:hypothetical protein